MRNFVTRKECVIEGSEAFSFFMPLSLTRLVASAMCCLALLLAGCATFVPSAGPSASRVRNADDSQRLHGIKVQNLDNDVVIRLAAFQGTLAFSEQFGDVSRAPVAVAPGDVLEVTLWEMPPALFGGAPSGMVFPQQTVSDAGTISIPYAGQVNVAGFTPGEIEREIKSKLAGKANQPQVLVRVVSNNTATVTVVGEVASSMRMPLTAKREQLLDALAAAGGTTQPVEKMTLQLTRGGSVAAMSLEQIIRDPRQNIVLLPGDVVTLLYQPLSLTALGAVGKNAEINFEAKGITLSQAMGRIGGLMDNRANPKGVFIFRFEDSRAVPDADAAERSDPAGKLPVIYRVDFNDPASFFLSQHFMMQDKDLVYVSNAPSADFQKFLNMVVSVVYPVVNIINAVP